MTAFAIYNFLRKSYYFITAYPIDGYRLSTDTQLISLSHNPLRAEHTRPALFLPRKTPTARKRAERRPPAGDQRSPLHSLSWCGAMLAARRAATGSRSTGCIIGRSGQVLSPRTGAILLPPRKAAAKKSLQGSFFVPIFLTKPHLASKIYPIILVI